MAVICGMALLASLVAQVPAAPVASEPSDAVKPDDNKALAIPQSSIEVKVIGRRTRSAVAAGDFRLKIGELAAVPRPSAESLLTLAPGLMLSNEGGEGHASSIFLRGFNAGEGQDVEILADGVPINEPSNLHGHGRANSHFLIPELISELRVLQGPFDARQGDFAVAGSAEYSLGLGHRGLTMKAGLGSFGRRRLVLLYGPKEKGPGTFMGADLTEGAGFGPNRAHASSKVMARHETALGDDTILTLFAQSYVARFDSAGLIRDDDFQARTLPCGPSRDEQFFCLYDGNQGEASSRHAVSARLTRPTEVGTWDSLTFVTLQRNRVRQNTTGYLTDVSTAGLPQRGDGVEQSHDAVTIGSRGGYRLARPSWPWLREVEGGYAFRHDAADAVQRRLRTVGGAPYRVENDDRLHLTNLGFFLQSRATMGSRVTLAAGLRAEAFLFSVKDNNRPAADRSGSRETSEAFEAYGKAFLPKASLTVAVTRSLDLLASHGVGARSSQAQGLSDGEIAPFARVHASEIGLALHHRSASHVSVDARAIAFHTRVERDLLFDELRARNVMTGASNRLGGLLFLRTTLPQGFDVLASATYTEAYLPAPGTPWLHILTGTRLPYVPRWVVRSDAVYKHAMGEQLFWGLAAGLTYVAPRPLPHEQLSPHQLNVDASVRVSVRRLELALEVTNAFDRRNREAVFNYASNFRGPDEPSSMLPQQHFAAGAPRTFLLTLTSHLGG